MELLFNFYGELDKVLLERTSALPDRIILYGGSTANTAYLYIPNDKKPNSIKFDWWFGYNISANGLIRLLKKDSASYYSDGTVLTTVATINSRSGSATLNMSQYSYSGGFTLEFRSPTTNSGTELQITITES